MEDEQWRIFCLKGTGTVHTCMYVHDSQKTGLQYSPISVSQWDFSPIRLRVGSGPSFSTRMFVLSVSLLKAATIARLDAQRVPAWLMGSVMSDHMFLWLALLCNSPTFMPRSIRIVPNDLRILTPSSGSRASKPFEDLHNWCSQPNVSDVEGWS